MLFNANRHIVSYSIHAFHVMKFDVCFRSNKEFKTKIFLILNGKKSSRWRPKQQQKSHMTGIHEYSSAVFPLSLDVRTRSWEIHRLNKLSYKSGKY